jgi:hypothetical protein
VRSLLGRNSAVDVQLIAQIRAVTLSYILSHQ